MASFNSAYGLCHLIDQKSLLGVSDDQDHGCVIVTMGKNIAMRYRFSDQKQLTSWSTIVKFSTHVVYNQSENLYLGIFENRILKHWSVADPNLEKVKKTKFTEKIFKILIVQQDYKDLTVVVFQNGSTVLWNPACKTLGPKSSGILNEKEKILDCWIVKSDFSYRVVFIVQLQQKHIACYSIILDSMLEIDAASCKKKMLRRQGMKLLGWTLLEKEHKNFVLTLWSDGFLYSTNTQLEKETVPEVVGQFFGTINQISKKSNLSMCCLSSEHLAVYAADATDEGATLLIYNTTFNIVQAKTHFKMFNNPPRLFKSRENLLIVMGQNLVCVPYKLETESLSAILGSQKLSNNTVLPSDIVSITTTADWEEDKDVLSADNVDLKCPKDLEETLQVLTLDGWSESQICEHIFSDLMKSMDVNSMYWCLKNFLDIPEKLLVELLTLCLTQPNSIFEDLKYEAGQMFVDSSEKSNEILNPFNSNTKCIFINTILKIPVNSDSLFQNLKKFLKFEDSLLLLKYFTYLLSNSDMDCQMFVLEWSNILISSFYQQYILSKDASVLESLILLQKCVDLKQLELDECSEVLSLLYMIKNGKNYDEKVAKNVFSTVKLKLY